MEGVYPFSEDEGESCEVDDDGEEEDDDDEGMREEVIDVVVGIVVVGGCGVGSVKAEANKRYVDIDIDR